MVLPATDGGIATGWVKVASSWYYMNADGVMVTGWLRTATTNFQLRADSAAAIGWANDDCLVPLRGRRACSHRLAAD